LHFNHQIKIHIKIIIILISEKVGTTSSVHKSVTTQWQEQRISQFENIRSEQ